MVPVHNLVVVARRQALLPACSGLFHWHCHHLISWQIKHQLRLEPTNMQTLQTSSYDNQQTIQYQNGIPDSRTKFKYRMSHTLAPSVPLGAQITGIHNQGITMVL